MDNYYASLSLLFYMGETIMKEMIVYNKHMLIESIEYWLYKVEKEKMHFECPFNLCVDNFVRNKFQFIEKSDNTLIGKYVCIELFPKASEIGSSDHLCSPIKCCPCGVYSLDTVKKYAREFVKKLRKENNNDTKY